MTSDEICKINKNDLGDMDHFGKKIEIFYNVKKGFLAFFNTLLSILKMSNI